MRKFTLLNLSIICALTLLSACAPAVAVPTEEPTEATEAPAEGRPLVLGDIGDDPAVIIEGTQPMADYIASQLGDNGIASADVRIAASADEMSQMLETGEVDLYFDSAYPAMLIADSSGAEPVLRRWRRGVGEYHTVIFTTKDSGIESLEDLESNVIAMDNEFSTSGFVLPAVYMIEHGLTLKGLKSYDQNAPTSKVGFVFSNDDENTLQWVISGLVAAGATDNVSFENYPDDVRENLVVLAETESVPRQIVLVSPAMDDDLKAALLNVLTGMDETDEGRAALESFEDTIKFDEFPEGIEAALARMRELQEIVAEIDMP